MDSFLGCYEDGTEPGTRDCRWVASIFFLVPLLAFVLGAISPTDMFFVFSSILCTLLAILLIAAQPFRSNVSYYTDINAVFVILLALYHTTCIEQQNNKGTANLPFLFASCFAVILPLLYTLIVSLKWMHTRKDMWVHVMMEKFRYFSRRGYLTVE